MDDLRLALFTGTSTDIITVADALELTARQRGRRTIDPSRGCISLVVDGEERWGPRLSFGALGPLVDQLAPAADRLTRGERGVIRAQGFSGPVTEYVLLDPDGEDLTATIAATDTIEVWDWMPHGPRAGELYEFIAAHFGEMVRLGEHLRDLEPVRISTETIIASLRRESLVGLLAVETLGRGDL